MAPPSRKGLSQAVAVNIWDETTKKEKMWDGSVFMTETPITDTPEYFEDTSFVAGDSPVTLDINTALARNATAVLIINDGLGDFTYALSADGTIFGDEIKAKNREQHRYEDVSIDSIRITHSGTDSAYRVIAI